jgi:hypothetical protein
MIEAMATTRFTAECDVHLTPMDPAEGCHYCLRFLADPPDVDDLPAGVRMDELEQWLMATRSVPADMLYRRIEQLVGRSISMHELEDPDRLMERARRPKRQWDWWDDW